MRGWRRRWPRRWPRCPECRVWFTHLLGIVHIELLGFRIRLIVPRPDLSARLDIEEPALPPPEIDVRLTVVEHPAAEGECNLARRVVEPVAERNRLAGFQDWNLPDRFRTFVAGVVKDDLDLG